ncbi:2-succinyl-6-hydroxy-2,4-cyclohexadiene-1-carboxylate synthase [Paenisporosarcina sp. TG20]|uniref:2-succinyl-6-hydroxy-2, 4-cyclohexadiene-1-carboxylate synthase n=1 Tax=Paenisporosarcina sp. TG20 TaxID=1211706 RepID=UPI0002D2D6D6|nr:2-succinyl-6-hydroxy-2,4-cyclohexadiene-1-carboxylate synthase [Paenisporosarcina sp. TG20]
MEQLILKVRGVEVGCTITNREAVDTIVFLHGFTGSTMTWEPIIEDLPKTIRCIAVDLLGHGKSESPKSPNRYQMNEQLLDLHTLFGLLQVTTFSLVGYSMGGRIALAYALKYPEHIIHLILESASPGLASLVEQQARVKADERLAGKIEIEGISKFIDYWQDISLFHSQEKLSEWKRLAIRQERLLQSPLGLANSLRGIGTGNQPSYWLQLKQLKIPVTLVTGEFDQKFNLIAQQMKKSLSNSQHIQVLTVGHAIHVENPVQFATIIREQVIDGI